jgi:hypothetical protein
LVLSKHFVCLLRLCFHCEARLCSIGVFIHGFQLINTGRLA